MLDIITCAQAERFWTKVDVSAGTDACWPWMAGLFRQGYGMFGIGLWPDDTHRTVYAHRVAWTLTHKADVPALWVSGKKCIVRHICDNRLCCNPAHLLLGDNDDNMRDMVERGRSRYGERHPMMKISDHGVSCVFALRERGLTQQQIGEIVGCSQVNVSYILSGKTRAVPA